MSDHATASHDEHAPAVDPAHHADEHDAGHDGHHDGGTLGPVDRTMWLVGVVGVIAGLVVTAGFAVATGFNFLDLL